MHIFWRYLAAFLSACFASYFVHGGTAGGIAFLVTFPIAAFVLNRVWP
ncbi:MAG: hypothetical protein NVSMB48_23600 [Marmoricola sp.]